MNWAWAMQPKQRQNPIWKREELVGPKQEHSMYWVSIILFSVILYVCLLNLYSKGFGKPNNCNICLVKMARDFFSAQATSTPSERTFSYSGKMVVPIRNRLKGPAIEESRSLASWLPFVGFRKEPTCDAFFYEFDMSYGN
jgi:hypothetical protein